MARMGKKEGDNVVPVHGDLNLRKVERCRGIATTHHDDSMLRLLSIEDVRVPVVEWCTRNFAVA